MIGKSRGPFGPDDWLAEVEGQLGREIPDELIHYCSIHYSLGYTPEYMVDELVRLLPDGQIQNGEEAVDGQPPHL